MGAGGEIDVLDESGRVRRAPEVIALLHDAVRNESSLAPLVDAVPDVLPWGTTGMYFTGHWSDPPGDVVLKVGVSAAQRFWSETLADRHPDLAPRVFASGSRLGGIELGWVVMERIPYGLDQTWGGAEFDLLMDAGARFQSAARTMEHAPHRDLSVDDVRRWVEAGRRRDAPGAVAMVVERLADDWTFVNRVCGAEICHGDLHLANALMRQPAPDLTPALLIDEEPRRMPWLFDAAYAQVVNSDPERPGWHDLVAQMAERRRVHGLPVGADDDLGRASTIALAWYALRMWGIFGADTDPVWRPPAVWREQNAAYVEAGAALPR